MADLLATGSAWLSGVMQAHAAKSIAYRRGTSSVTISNATVGRTEFEIVDQNQMLVKVESRDYIFSASQLVIASATVLPEQGDLIDEVVGAETWTFEVMAPAPRSAPWRYSDPYHQRLRVHTKLVKKA